MGSTFLTNGEFSFCDAARLARTELAESRVAGADAFYELEQCDIDEMALCFEVRSNQWSIKYINSVGAFPGKDHWDGAQQNFEIVGEGPIPDIVDVEF